MFIAKKVHIASVAVSFCLFSSCNSFIAFSPIGVAALPSPSILAAIFNTIDPIAGWSLGTFGKSLIMIGLSAFAIIWMSPESSAIFIIPSQRAIIPIRPNAISTDVLDMFIAASVTWSILPVIVPTTTDINIKANQI